ncbi:MAG: hypothetical protein GX786_06625 [Clostridiales bacterium]|nr:hypothetical protein [Clostridiales bacterium]
MDQKKVRICKKCSGLDVEKLKEHLSQDAFSYGCIGKCLHRCPELQGTCYGYIDQQFEIFLTEEAFLEKVDEAVKGES